MSELENELIRRGWLLPAGPLTRPFQVNTFPLDDEGCEIIVLIEKRGDPIKLLIGGAEIAIGPGFAIALGKAITAAGHATLVERRRVKAAKDDVDHSPVPEGEV